MDGGATPPRVTIDGNTIKLSLPPAVDAQRLPRVIAVHKPRGVVSAWGPFTVDGFEVPRPTLDSLDSLKNAGRLMHVGRLDADSEGLLLLTDDGLLANAIAHPSTGPSKVYVLSASPSASLAAASDSMPRPTPAAALCARLTAEGGLMLPADARDGPVPPLRAQRPARALRARLLPASIAGAALGAAAVAPRRGQAPPLFIELTLGEGRKRLARRLLAACGWRVDRLLRVSVGPVRLGNLAAGEKRQLTQREVNALYTSTRARAAEAPSHAVPRAPEELK